MGLGGSLSPKNTVELELKIRRFCATSRSLQYKCWQELSCAHAPSLKRGLRGLTI
jgi:hypothetical protein